MEHRYRLALAVLIAACLIMAGLMYATWPATGTLYPPVTPTTYGPPGPNGGPQ